MYGIARCYKVILSSTRWCEAVRGNGYGQDKVMQDSTEVIFSITQAAKVIGEFIFPDYPGNPGNIEFYFLDYPYPVFRCNICLIFFQLKIFDNFPKFWYVLFPIKANYNLKVEKSSKLV